MPTAALIQDTMEMVASRESLGQTTELLIGTRGVLASSRELLKRTEALLSTVDAPPARRKSVRMTRLELTDEQREALLQLLEEELRDPRYPHSPETEALRAIAAQLLGEGEHKRPRR
jgi:hypothetical protein